MTRHLAYPVLWLCLFFLIPPAVAQGKKAEEAQRLLLFYSNDVRGEIEPCG